MIDPLYIAIISLVAFAAQLVDFIAKHRDGALKAYEVVTKSALLFCTLAVVVLGGANAVRAYRIAAPRSLSHRDQYVKTLGEFKGLTVQVVGAGFSRYTEACDFKTALYFLFRDAGWRNYFGECNRPPWSINNSQTGWQIQIDYDRRAQKAAFGLVHLLSKESWAPIGTLQAFPAIYDGRIIALGPSARAFGIDPDKWIGSGTGDIGKESKKALARHKAAVKYWGTQRVQTSADGTIDWPAAYPVDMVVTVFDKIAP